MFLFRARKKKQEFRYRRCPNCNALAWQANGRGEVVERFGELYARQYHTCLNCGMRMNLIRMMRSQTWSRTVQEALLSK